MRASFVIHSFVAIVGAHSVLAQAPDRSVSVGRMDSIATAFLREGPTAGLTAAVIRGSDTLYFRGVGESDREKHLAPTRGTVYRIGSITKQFTSAAIMQLAEQGKLKLTDSLGTLLPQYPQWKGITLRQLLTHTSGIHSYTANEKFNANRGSRATPAEVMAYVASDTLDFAPSTKYLYNNSGYFLLGMILERVEKKPYADIVRDRFFRPLGLRSGTYCPNQPPDSTYAMGYDKAGTSINPAGAVDMSVPFSAGALCMSAEDFLKWQTALTSGKVVKPATFAQMTTSDTLLDGKATGYGFGHSMGSRNGHRFIQHGGDINGGSTAQFYFPDDSLRIIAFTNTLGSGPSRLAMNLASVVLGMPLVPAAVVAPSVPLASADRAKYEGTYDLKLPNGVTLPLRIFTSGDGLSLQAQGQGAFAMRYLGNDVFGAAFDPTLRITILFENGRAVRARLFQGGGTVEGARQP